MFDLYDNLEMENLVNNLDNLKKICNCTKKTNTKNLINSSKDKSLIKVLSDCILNTLNGNINLPEKEKKKLKKFKSILRQILNEKVLTKKKKLLIQHGQGFLSILLPGAISLISALIDNFKKK